MNHNKKVVTFIIVTTFFLFIYSLYAALYQPGIALSNISILSDVVKQQNTDNQSNTDTTAIATVDVALPQGPLPPRMLDLYKRSGAITGFYTDTSLAALPALNKKLHEIKTTKKGKVRIAWLGDSMIEGDLLTQTVRRKLQLFCGGFGVGFIPATSVTAAFRTSATHKWKGEWKEESFITRDLTAPLFFSGHLFYTADGEITIKDNTIKDSAQLTQKYLLCGPAASGGVSILVNGQPKQFSASGKINRLLLESSTSRSITVGVKDDKLPVYGISIEPEQGVVLDNFSFRGITGLELNKLDTAMLQAIQRESPYDLVVLEYGANLMFRPDDNDYSWFHQHIIPVMRKMQKAMPGVEFLIVSTSDRAFKYGEEYKTATGIHNLVKTQARLAYDNGAAFYNMFASMGGSGTIVKWADTTPSLANKDYVHPNLRGAEILGSMLGESFIKDYNKKSEKASDKVRYLVTSCHSILDKSTNLEWYIGDDIDYNTATAAKWARNLNVCESKWRLPTVAEVLTLYHKDLSAGAGYVRDSITYTAHIDPVFAGIGHSAWVWTSESSDTLAYTVNLHEGVKVRTKKDGANYPVRAFAVRKMATPIKTKEQ